MKIAISLPKEEFLFIENLKHKLKISRSKLVQQAIDFWIQYRRQKEVITKYESGYRKKPEKLSSIAHMEKTQYEALSNERW